MKKLLIWLAWSIGLCANAQDKTPQTITWADFETKTYGDSEFEITATASSGLTVSFSSSHLEVATISGTTVTIVGGGTTTITASQAGNEVFAAVTAEKVLTVDKADQFITFSPMDPVEIFGDPVFSPNAYASSELAVEYTSSDPQVASVTDAGLALHKIGETTVTALQPGNGNYNAAIPISHVLSVVAPAIQPQQITFSLGTDANKIYGDEPFALSATGGGSGHPVRFSSSNLEVATIEGNMVTIVGVGTTSVIASQEGSAGYSPADDVDQLLTVSKASQNILFGALSDKTLGDAAVTLTATASSGLAVSYSISSDKATLSANLLTLVNPGRVAITAAQVGDANFLAADPAERSFCINPPKPMISVTGENSETPTLTSSASAGNRWFKNGTPIGDATSTSLTVSAQGTYTVQVTIDDCESVLSEPKDVIITGYIRNTDGVVRAYPNPVVDFLHIDGVGPGKQWWLSDLLDRKMSVPVESYGATHRADVRGLSSGMYVIRISDGTSVQLIKVIKQ